MIKGINIALKPGTRVVLKKANADIPLNSKGAVVHKTDTGVVFVIWDTGRFYPVPIKDISCI